MADGFQFVFQKFFLFFESFLEVLEIAFIHRFIHGYILAHICFVFKSRYYFAESGFGLAYDEDIIVYEGVEKKDVSVAVGEFPHIFILYEFVAEASSRPLCRLNSKKS